MTFAAFSQYLQELEQVSARLDMTAALAKLYRELKPDEVRVASYLLQGQLVPPYESLEFQLSVKMVLRALARISGTGVEVESMNLFGESDETASSTNEELMTKRYKALGDIGLVAAEVMDKDLVAEVKAGPSIKQVYETLTAIAQTSGEGSQEKKLEGLVTLLKQLDPISAKFVVRIIVGKLRLGFSTMTLIDALSWAMTDGKNESTLLEETYQKKADIGRLAEAYLVAEDAGERQKRLQEYTVEVGVPVVPALCQRLNTVQEISDKMGEVYIEPKYDGLRVQIHIDKTAQGGVKVKTFTRNLEESSEMFPELKSAVDSLNCQSCIIDAEGIGYDPTTSQLVTFQKTITRKRKHGVEEVATSVPLRFYVFDVLSVDGKSFLQEPLRERKAVLKRLFKDNEVFVHAPYTQSSDPEEIRTLHTEFLAEGLEGAVFKQVDSPYQSGRKGWSWVKMKETEGTRGKLTDTLDCVVLGYYLGRGKRHEFGLGAFLAGVLDDEGRLKTIAKIGTGLTDEQLAFLKQLADKQAVSQAPSLYDVPKALAPDVWCQPSIVVEIAADELTQSPLHTAGVALRFPRLVRFRDDKTWEQATTLSEVKGMLLVGDQQSTEE
jgi:DNA ligase-1